jgi:hypothetical protein
MPRGSAHCHFMKTCAKFDIDPDFDILFHVFFKFGDNSHQYVKRCDLSTISHFQSILLDKWCMCWHFMENMIQVFLDISSGIFFNCWKIINHNLVAFMLCRLLQDLTLKFLSFGITDGWYFVELCILMNYFDFRFWTFCVQQQEHMLSFLSQRITFSVKLIF